MNKLGKVKITRNTSNLNKTLLSLSKTCEIKSIRLQINSLLLGDKYMIELLHNLKSVQLF